MRDTGIADRLRAAGLAVVECSGWQTRGSDSFDPRGSVDHHTAGPASGDAPSLNTVIHGRPDLAGPLCNVLVGRHSNTCYVVAAGRANHAGSGGWAGLTGNSSVYGIERENVGTTAEPWRPDQTDAAARAHAALIRGRADQSTVCRHAEWAPTRKPDTHSLEGDDLRRRIAQYLGATPSAPDQPEGPPTMFVAIDSVALCALFGQVLFTFSTMDAYAESLNGSPGVPALIVGQKTPLEDRHYLYQQLFKQHVEAVGA